VPLFSAPRIKTGELKNVETAFQQKKKKPKTKKLFLIEHDVDSTFSTGFLFVCFFFSFFFFGTEA
jgi:hypothetical protein